MEIELKPCPFCGSREISLHESRGEAVVICNDCDARGPDSTVTYHPSCPMELWNRRHFPEGCTPADARHLREANHALAIESEKFEFLLTTAMEVIREADLLDEFAIKRGELTKAV